MVQKFLNAQKIWIMEQQLKLQGHSEKPTLLYAGKHHEVILQPNHGKEPIVFEEDRVIISPFDHSVEGTTKVIDRFLKAQAAEDLLPLLTKTGQEMGIEVPAASLRDTSSRWGSCSYRGAISLSWRLIHAPHEVRRYVVVHELAHRIHFNHSDRFWQLVSQYDPEHPLHRGWLKRHGHLCRTPDVSSLLT